ncbi:anti-sigma factor family protein [Desulforudis sp. 1088]|uniref:anti-sigma factor family protein n=1 Tax=unclassified Candidatus Desulforudis TaxID=2635950 RepID=UPI003CE48EB4
MCFEEGKLRAYLDGEVPPWEAKAVASHLELCSACRMAVEELKANESFVNEVLDGCLAEAGVQRRHLAASWARMAAQNETLPAHLGKGVRQVMTRFKTAAIVAATVLALALPFSYAPVRSFAAELLTIFRVERIQVIDISPETLAQLEDAFRNGNGTVNIENFGRVTCSGSHELREVSREEAGKAADFKIKLPAAAGYENPSFGLLPESTVTLTLDVDKVNSFLQLTGSTTLLPDFLDGKDFSLRIPTVVVAEYDLADGRRIAVAQGRSPELIVPEGTDVFALRDALLSIPALPSSIRNQLAAVTDWQHTVLIPNIQGSSQEVSVNGRQGVFIADEDSGPSWSGLIWPEDGVLYVIAGDNLSLTEGQTLAGTLK